MTVRLALGVIVAVLILGAAVGIALGPEIDRRRKRRSGGVRERG